MHFTVGLFFKASLEEHQSRCHINLPANVIEQEQNVKCNISGNEVNEVPGEIVALLRVLNKACKVEHQPAAYQNDDLVYQLDPIVTRRHHWPSEDVVADESSAEHICNCHLQHDGISAKNYRKCEQESPSQERGRIRHSRSLEIVQILVKRIILNLEAGFLKDFEVFLQEFVSQYRCTRKKGYHEYGDAQINSTC